MIHQKSTRNGLVCTRVEGALKRLEEVGYIFVEVSYFSRYSADNLGLVCGKMGEVLCSLGMLDLELMLVNEVFLTVGCCPYQLIAQIAIHDAACPARPTRSNNVQDQWRESRTLNPGWALESINKSGE